VKNINRSTQCVISTFPPKCTSSVCFKDRQIRFISAWLWFINRVINFLDVFRRPVFNWTVSLKFLHSGCFTNSSTLKMEAIYLSESSLSFQRSSQRYVTEVFKYTPDWPSYSQVKVKVTLRLTVSQSVSLGIYLLVWQLRSCFLWGVFSDERTGLSFLYAAGPCQRSVSRVRVPWDLRPYFTVSHLRLPFSSPRTTRRVTVEVFDPASTRGVGCKWPSYRIPRYVFMQRHHCYRSRDLWARRDRGILFKLGALLCWVWWAIIICLLTNLRRPRRVAACLALMWNEIQEVVHVAS
jgi:hypothetical protein